MKSKKLRKYVKDLVSSFKKTTKKSLKYVMVPNGTSKKVIEAFQKRKVTVITPEAINAKGLGKLGAGLFVVDASKKEDVRAVLKAVKDKTLSTVNLVSCVKPGQTVDLKSAEVVKTRRMNAGRANEENTDASEAENTEQEQQATEGTNTAANTAQQTTDSTTATDAASALTASSFIAVAVVSAVAMIML